MNIKFLKSYKTDLIFWLTLSIYRNKKNKDVLFLRKNYIKKINGWAIMHYLSYFHKGIRYKKKYLIPFFLVGTSFEFIEYFIQYNTNIKFVDSSIIRDPIINTIGYLTGIITIYIIKKLKKNNNYLK